MPPPHQVTTCPTLCCGRTSILALDVFVPSDKEPLRINRAIVKWAKGSDFGIDLEAPNPQSHERLVKTLSMLITERHRQARS
jgi:hypothetical protein